MYSPKYVDYLDEKRIESAFYNPKSKLKTWVGIKNSWYSGRKSPNDGKKPLLRSQSGAAEVFDYAWMLENMADRLQPSGGCAAGVIRKLKKGFDVAAECERKK